MSDGDKLAATRREDYKHFLAIPTRWMDNDVYGHVNNVVYYAYFDTVINRFLIEQGGLDIERSPVIAVCVDSQCSYKHSIAFPDLLHTGLRVEKLGNSSVRYSIGIFHGQVLCALGSFVHVFVERTTRKPTPIPSPIREALSRLATTS